MSDLITLGFTPKEGFQIPRGSQLLLIGPPSVVKTHFVLRYLADRLQAKEPAAYSTTLWSPKQIRQLLGQIGGKQVASQLRIADGVSCVTAQPSTEPYSFKNLYDLNTINLVLLQAIADLENGHLCLDNLTTLMTYSAPLSVIKFIQVLCARVKNSGVTGIYLIEEGVHTKAIVATLRFTVDGVIEIQDEETKGSSYDSAS
ncbi:MAG: RAD55 family ATPase [Candidatus Hermodarchaeia archaeon]